MSAFSWVYAYDLHDLLEVDPSCTEADLTAAYRRKCLQHHPDKGGDMFHFQQIAAAHAVLKDPTELQLWRAYQSQPETSSASSSGTAAAQRPQAQPQARPPAQDWQQAWKASTRQRAVLAYCWRPAIDACVGKVNAWLPDLRKGHPDRQVVAQRKVALRGFRHVPALAAFLGPMLHRLAQVCVDSAGVSWSSTLKPVSHEGYDIYKNRIVDYGNFQYRAWLTLLESHDARIGLWMAWAATAFPTLHPHYADTDDSLEHQGDIVEIILALCRARRCWGIYEMATPAEWRQHYVMSIALARSIDYLYAHVRGKSTKLEPWDTVHPALSNAFGDADRGFMTSYSAHFAAVVMCIDV